MADIRVRRQGDTATVEHDIDHGIGRYQVVVQLDVTAKPPTVSEVTIKTGRGAVSARDIRRLPLSNVIAHSVEEASIAAATMASGPLSGRELRRARQRLREAVGQASPLPRGRPARGRAERFYRELLAHVRGLEQMGISPVADIAKRKDVDPNTVRQWIHRARKLESSDLM